MRDPTGDLPWDEDETAQDVVHLPDNPVSKMCPSRIVSEILFGECFIFCMDFFQSLNKLLKKESSSGKGILVMFYAPWCGFCKRMKPDYSAAATEVKTADIGILAAIDVNKPENGVVRQKYNISGFPTLIYFR